jgi:hypothetical protein
MLCDTELCLELNISIEIKYIKIYLGFIEKYIKQVCWLCTKSIKSIENVLKFMYAKF